MTERVFNSSQWLQPAEGEPIRSVVAQSPDAVVVAWYVKPGQTIKSHRHPQGQDTWTILSGAGDYRTDLDGATRRITGGDIVIAHSGELHGVHNSGDDPLVFISVVSPAEAGYELLETLL